MEIGLSKKGITFFDEEFLVAVALQLDSNDFVNPANGVAKFLIEAFSFDVGTDNDMRVTSPSIESLLIERSGGLYALTSCGIVGPRVKLLRADGSSDQVQHSIVPLVPDRGPRPALFVQDGLKFFLGNVGSGVAGAPIAYDDGRRFAHHSQLREIIFHVHLEADQQTLKFDSLLDAELGHEDHAACLDDQGWDLRDGEDSETFVGHFFLDLGERGALAATWSSSDDYLIDRISSLKPRKILFLILL